MTDPARSLFTRNFLLSGALLFLAQVSVAAFFPFHEHLIGIGFDEKGAGFLISVFSLAVLGVRPAVSTFLHARNARPVTLWAAAATGAALLLYGLAASAPALLLLRFAHGAVYSVFLAGVTTQFTAGIPEGRSGEAFGWISVVLLVPYAVVPPLVAPLERMAGGFGPALALLSVATFAQIPLASLLRPVATPDFAASRISWDAFQGNLRSGPVLVGLLLTLAVWTAYGALFTFLNGLGIAAGIPSPGLFLTVATGAEAAVRVLGGRLLDRIDKLRGLAAALLVLAAAYALLPLVARQIPFLAVAVVVGLAWGLAMPFLSGYLFDVSPPPLRPLNTNLGMAVCQAGFFVGPALGGPLLQAGGHLSLFLGCAGISLAAAAVAVASFPPPSRRTGWPSTSPTSGS